MTIEEIKIYMKNNKISQIELSKNSGIPLGTIRNIFSGRVPSPRLDTINAIIKALNIDIKIPKPGEFDQLPSVQIIDERLIKSLEKLGVSTYDLTKLNEKQIALIANMIAELKNK